MPIYDYQCRDCGNIQEELVLLEEVDSTETICNKCYSTNMNRLMGAPGFIIHGFSAANGYASRNRFGTGESEAGEKVI